MSAARGVDNLGRSRFVSLRHLYYYICMAEEPRQERKITPEEEIKELERKLQEKKRALVEQGASGTEEKEVFREVMREHVEAVMPAPTAGGAAPVSHLPSVKKPQKIGDDASGREERLRSLIERALTRNIADAVDTAYSESPYLLDELHDRLVDEYYDKLVALRKIDAS